jgi:hypothetical protein
VSKYIATPDSLRKLLAELPEGHALYPDAQLFAEATANEQAALLNQVLHLLGSGVRNLGPLLAWEITFGIARKAAKLEQTP